MNGLKSFVLESLENPGSRVLAGGPDVGKTTVLRSLARDFAVAFMKDDRPLPIFLPLQDVRVEDDAVSEILGASDEKQGHIFFDYLMQDWSVWANSIIYSNAVTPTAISEWLQNDGVVLVLDSVDEFLMINPRFELLHFLRLRDYVLREFKNNHRLRLIFGVRSSQLGYGNLASGSGVSVISPLN